MKNIFIFSSPLHYTFANLIAQQFKDATNLGYYYTFHNDMTDRFDQIDAELGHRLDRQELTSLAQIPDRPDRLFIPNRFGDWERAIFHSNRITPTEFNLYEEGASLYLKSAPGQQLKNDKSLAVKLINTVRKLRGKPPCLIYLNQFSSIYSVFPNIPYYPKGVPNINIAHLLNSLVAPTKKDSADCLFLSQFFVRENTLSEADYLKYIAKFVSYAEKKYKTIYYKAHPRDHASLTEKIFKQFSVQAIPEPYNTLPAEFFVGKFNITIYGFWTTTLLYAKRMGINSFSLFKDICQSSHSKQLNAYYRRIKSIFADFDIPEFQHPGH